MAPMRIWLPIKMPSEVPGFSGVLEPMSTSALPSPDQLIDCLQVKLRGLAGCCTAWLASIELSPACL